MDGGPAASALGLDFGTTNTVVALTDGDGGSDLIDFVGDEAAGPVFRSALCFWEDDRGWNGVAHEAGPWAIAEYLQSPLDSRFIQSFKSVAASASFERAMIFNKPFRFEDLGRLFLQKLVAHAGGRLDERPRRVVVGRPVEYAGARGPTRRWPGNATMRCSRRSGSRSIMCSSRSAPPTAMRRA